MQILWIKDGFRCKDNKLVKIELNIYYKFKKK